MEKKNKKVWRTVSNIIFVVLIALLLIPSGRVWVQQGMMKIGLFRAKLEAPKENLQVDADAQKLSSKVSFMDDAGNEVKLADLQGKVVFINYWATWCPPCKAEMPSIQALKDKFEGNEDLVFMLVELETAKEKAREFMTAGKMNLPLYYPAGAIPKEWLSGTVPTTMILDKEGNVAMHHEGMADYSRKSVVEFVTDLLSK